MDGPRIIRFHLGAAAGAAVAASSSYPPVAVDHPKSTNGVNSNNNRVYNIVIGVQPVIQVDFV